MYEKIKKDIYPFLTNQIVNQIELLDKKVFEKISEIRIRVNKNIIIKLFDIDIILNYIVTIEDIKKILEKITNFSIYSMQDDINQGYITIKGGHRIGLCGTSVVENEKIVNVKNISSINIRLARQIIGVSDHLYRKIYFNEFENTLIVSSPGCGKTTLLRDLIRNLSNKKYNVCVIDERLEIGATYNGIMQMNLGIRTDLINRCKKHLGIINAIRSMGPDIIAVDEIGSIEDVQAIKQAIYSGVKLICTMHGNSIDDIYLNNIGSLVSMNCFKYVILLKKDIRPGIIDKIYYLNSLNKYKILENIENLKGA